MLKYATQLKQLPNYKPVDLNFDARHLDKFIKQHELSKNTKELSGEIITRSSQVNKSVEHITIVKEFVKSAMTRASQIRPSTSFTSKGRDFAYADLIGAPKSLFNSRTD